MLAITVDALFILVDINKLPCCLYVNTIGHHHTQH